MGHFLKYVRNYHRKCQISGDEKFISHLRNIPTALYVAFKPNNNEVNFNVIFCIHEVAEEYVTPCSSVTLTCKLYTMWIPCGRIKCACSPKNLIMSSIAAVNGRPRRRIQSLAAPLVINCCVNKAGGTGMVGIVWGMVCGGPSGINGSECRRERTCRGKIIFSVKNL